MIEVIPMNSVIGQIQCVQEVKEECDPEDDEEEEEEGGSCSRLMEELLEGIPTEDKFRREDGLASLEGISLPSSPLIALASDESNRNTSLADSVNRHINRLTPTWLHQRKQHHIDEEAVKEFIAKGGSLGTTIGRTGFVDKNGVNLQKQLQQEKFEREAQKLWLRMRNEVISDLQDQGFDVE